MAIKVRVLRGVQAGLTGMSGLVVLSSGVSACATPTSNDDAATTGESGLTSADPGTGVLTLGWDYTTPVGSSFTAVNSTDEYVRAGERMTFTIPLYFLWERLYPGVALPDNARLQQLAATVSVQFVKEGAVASTTRVATNGSFQGSQTYDLAALSASFLVARDAQSMRFEIAASDAADATRTATIAATDLNEVPVFGGSLPSKTALFDTNGATFRQRIIEGGKPVDGANLAIGYTDWRAATLVDSSTIDRTIGNATSFSRFGSFQMAINGDLEHEITYGAAIDGAWHDGEQALSANTSSRLLPRGRVAYEGLLAVPNGASEVEIYVHVKTYLVVNYDKFSNVGWRKYDQGARILVREKWDNDHGAYASNYDFPTEVP